LSQQRCGALLAEFRRDRVVMLTCQALHCEPCEQQRIAR
jgi:hypothetical protein